MEHEMIDQYNMRGEKIGVVDKMIAHRDGLWHKSVHVWIINENGEVLLQYRCSDKSLYPDTWDASFAGHIGAGESSIEAVIREGKEELGIDVDLEKLEYIFTNKEILVYNDIDSREYVDIFILRQDIKVEDLVYQEEEVGGSKYVNTEEFFDLAENDKLFPHEVEYNVLKKVLRG